MDFGMPTLIEIESLREMAKLCMDLGLDFIELNMNMPQYQIDTLNIETIREYQNSPIYFTIHLDENLNIWDFNPLVSKAYSETVMAAIHIAKQANIPILNMHMNNGVHFTLPDKKVFLFEQYKDSYMQKTHIFRQQCLEAIGESNIKICIENCDGYTDFQLEAIEYLLESNIFGLTMDIGHNHGAGNKDESFIMQHNDKLCHMHIHDAIGAKNHLAVGTGEVDMQEKFHLANLHHCRCVLEIKTIESLKLSIHNLHNFFDGY